MLVNKITVAAAAANVEMTMVVQNDFKKVQDSDESVE